MGGNSSSADLLRELRVKSQLPPRTKSPRLARTTPRPRSSAAVERRQLAQETRRDETPSPRLLPFPAAISSPSWRTGSRGDFELRSANNVSRSLTAIRREDASHSQSLT